MLTVCVSASDPDLATTGDVMLELFGATTTDQVTTTGELNRISALVRRASAWAEVYVGYPLLAQVYSESLPAFGGRRLMVSRTPLRAVLRLFDSTATCTATQLLASCGEFLLEDMEAGLLARDEGFEWSETVRTSAGTFNFGIMDYHQPGMEERPWLCEYAAGWVPLGGITSSSDNYDATYATSTAPSVPEDVRHAVTLKAAAWFQNPLGLVSKRVGDLSLQYRSESEGPGLAEALLNPYRRII